MQRADTATGAWHAHVSTTLNTLLIGAGCVLTKPKHGPKWELGSEINPKQLGCTCPTGQLGCKTELSTPRSSTKPGNRLRAQRLEQLLPPVIAELF